jgi:hypothetical protein
LILSGEGDLYYEGEWANGLMTGKGGMVNFGLFEFVGDFLNG